MDKYVIDYINEVEFKKLERALKKYNMVAFKKLQFEYYPALRKGDFVGKLVSENKKNKTNKYEIKLPTYKQFSELYDDFTLHYTVYENDNLVLLDTITPTDILLEGHKNELTTYKGVLISQKNKEKDMFKIDLLNMMGDRSISTDFNYISNKKFKSSLENTINKSTASKTKKEKSTKNTKTKLEQETNDKLKNIELTHKNSSLTRQNNELETKIKRLEAENNKLNDEIQKKKIENENKDFMYSILFIGFFLLFLFLMSLISNS